MTPCETFQVYRAKARFANEFREPSERFTNLLAKLDLAWQYYIEVPAMKHARETGRSTIDIPWQPLWIELSEPFPCPLVPSLRKSRPSQPLTKVAAFWFSPEGPQDTFWSLELIGPDANDVDYFSLLRYPLSFTRNWNISSMRCALCAHTIGPEPDLCQQCHDFLRTWRKRFFTALRLIQQGKAIVCQ